MLGIIRGFKTPQPLSAVEKAAGVCLGRASVMMIKGLLKVSTLHLAGEKPALGSDLETPPAPDETWFLLSLCCRDSTQDPAVPSPR